MLFSSAGRFQFSVEKAYRVRASTPTSLEKRMISRRRSVPARWPAARGYPLRWAQRPLPSMMMATCRGRCSRARPIFFSCPSFSLLIGSNALSVSILPGFACI